MAHLEVFQERSGFFRRSALASCRRQRTDHRRPATGLHPQVLGEAFGAQELPEGRGTRMTWQTLDLEPFDDDTLTEHEKRLAETEPPVPHGGRREKPEPDPHIVTLAEVRRRSGPHEPD